MAYADDMVAQVSAILFKVNTDISVITRLMVNAEAIAGELLMLNTHQEELSSSAAVLETGIPDKFREVLQRYKLVADKLENYRSHL